MMNQRDAKSRNVTPKKRQCEIPDKRLKNINCVFCKHPFIAHDLERARGLYIPYLLNCGHSACGFCINEHSNERCTLCENGSSGETQDSDKKKAVELNFYVVGMMSQTKNRSTQQDDLDVSFATSRSGRRSMDRKECHDCGMRAVLFCCECNSPYCHSCHRTTHSKYKSLQNHRTILLPEVREQSLFTTVFCHQHNEIMDWFCTDCSCASCNRCLVQLHWGHKIIQQRTKNEDFFEEFQMARNKLAETLHRMQQTQKKIQKLRLSPKQLQSTEMIETSVNKHFAYLHGILQNSEKRFIDKLNEYRSFFTKNLNDALDHLKTEEDRISATLAASENIEGVMASANLQTLASQLIKMANAPCHFIDNYIPNEKITFTADPSIATIIDDHCKLEIPDVSQFSLLSQSSLPADYELEPLNGDEQISYWDASSVFETSSMRPASSCQSLSSCETTSSSLKSGGMGLVDVCHIENPSNFYVRRCTTRRTLVDLQFALQKYATHNSTVPDDIQQNILYVVRKKRNNKWYRGRVTEVNVDPIKKKETYQVLDVDCGSTEDNVPRKRIRDITPSLITTDPMAINCALHDIYPRDGKWSTEAIQAMANYVENRESITMHVVKSCGNTYHVDLTKEYSRHTECSRPSLRDSLIYLDHGALTTVGELTRNVPQAVQRFFVEDLKMEQFTAVFCFAVNSPDSIIVHKYENQHYLSTMMHNMQLYYEDKSKSSQGVIHVPEIGIPCAVKTSGNAWERGLISDILGSRKVEVTHVDYASKSTVPYTDIRKLHGLFMRCPAQAIEVSLVDVKPSDTDWSPEACALLQERIYGKISRIFAFEKNENRYSVSLYDPYEVNVASLLVEKNFAVSTGSRQV